MRRLSHRWVFHIDGYFIIVIIVVVNVSEEEEDKEDREMIEYESTEGMTEGKDEGKDGVTEEKEEGKEEGKDEITEGNDGVTQGKDGVSERKDTGKDEGKDEGLVEEIGGEPEKEETKPEGSGDISSTDEGKGGPIDTVLSETKIMGAGEFLALGKCIGDVNQYRDIIIRKPLTLNSLFVEKHEQQSKRKEETIPSSIVEILTGAY